jgi:hypothetical protein
LCRKSGEAGFTVRQDLLVGRGEMEVKGSKNSSENFDGRAQENECAGGLASY